jgi:Fe-S cluster assembly protein SufD
MFCQGCERADSETNIVIDIAEGASLDFCSVRKCAAGGRTVSAIEAILASASTLRLTDCRLGGGEISSSVYAELAGEGAEFDMKSLFFGSGEDRLDLDYRVGHFASRATSRIITKGVLGDGCRARYLARTDIAPGLEGSSGDERIDALMLSRNARLDCSPELTIDSNDVRCSHGMSVSGLDESRLFYLMSRGIDRVGAMQAAAKGFMSPVLESLADSTLKKSADGLLSARLRCALNK